MFKKINKWLNKETPFFVLGFLVGLGLFTFYVFTKSVIEVYFIILNNWIALFVIYPILWIATYSLLGKVKTFNLGFYISSILSFFVLITINFHLTSLI